MLTNAACVGGQSPQLLPVFWSSSCSHLAKTSWLSEKKSLMEVSALVPSKFFHHSFKLPMSCHWAGVWRRVPPVMHIPTTQGQRESELDSML